MSNNVWVGPSGSSENFAADVFKILVKASGMRLRAVFVTSLTTISGLLPTAYGIGGNDALLIPMTLAMAWGLTSGTILTLVWVPAASNSNSTLTS